jgi:hypothetical protein
VSAHTSDRPSGPGIAKCSASLSPDYQSNMQAKIRFEARLAELGLDKKSMRDLAAEVFQVPHSTLSERRSRRRVDLAPKDEWFAVLDDYAQWSQHNRRFGGAR